MTIQSIVTRRAIATLAVVAVIAITGNRTALAAEDAPFTSIVVFGDSLEDPGNAYFLTGEIATQPFEPIPSAAYAIGGHHFSNGSTWVEGLGRLLDLQRSTGPAYRNPAVASNYAVGGARARDVGTGIPAGQQVAAYLSYTGGTASADALYVVAFGGNDVRDALENPAAAVSILGQAAAAVADSLLTLCSAGAEEFLVANVANVGVTPAIRSIGEPAISYATYFSWTMNALVQANIAGYVQPACEQTRFRTLDLFTVSTTVVAYPAGFGFDDAFPCLTFFTTGDAICEDPTRKFFWDAIHPTAAGHELLAQEAMSLVSGP